MDQSQFSELKTMIESLDGRLRYLEQKLATKANDTQPDLDIKPLRAAMDLPGLDEVPPVVRKKDKPSGNILGIVGICCLILAMILLIRFSIDSGWLTPFRQVLLATLFGSALVATPFYVKITDRSYFSMMPAAGIVILHLTLYGATFYHALLSIQHGIWGVWAVGGLSLFLLSRFQEDVYAFLAICGTYIGSYLLRESFEHYSSVALHLIIWDIIFATFGIYLKKRLIITTAAYFSLLLVAMFALSNWNLSSETSIQLATIQLFQILVFAVATGFYSVYNKLTLKDGEAWQLFPVFLFFYGQEFSYFDTLNPTAALTFAFAFAFVIFGIYWIARQRLSSEKLESTPAVFTYLTIILLHAGYMVMLDDWGKLIAGLILLAGAGLFRHLTTHKDFKWSFLLQALAIGYSLLLVLLNPSELSALQVMGFGFIYALLFLIGYSKSSLGLLLAPANLLMVVSIWRLKDFLGESFIAPLCVAYAFACLIVAMKRSDRILGQAALPVIFVAVARFLFIKFSELTQGERIVSLIMMGALIYAAGYVYRKIHKTIL